MHSRASAEAGAGHQTLLVPLDGSYTAESALVHVVKAAQSSKIKVLLLNVQAPAHPDELERFNFVTTMEEHLRPAGEQSMNRAKRALDAYRIPATAEIVFGDPAEEIVKYAEKRRCDKIVMATRKRWSIDRLLHRSIIQRVTRDSNVPVTIVKSRATHTSPALCLYLDALFAPVQADESAADDLVPVAVG